MKFGSGGLNGSISRYPPSWRIGTRGGNGADFALRAGFALPASRSDQALLTAGRQFTQETMAFEKEFSGHDIGPAEITAVTGANVLRVLDQVWF